MIFVDFQFLPSDSIIFSQLLFVYQPPHATKCPNLSLLCFLGVISILCKEIFHSGHFAPILSAWTFLSFQNYLAAIDYYIWPLAAGREGEALLQPVHLICQMSWMPWKLKKIHTTIDEHIWAAKYIPWKIRLSQ